MSDQSRIKRLAFKLAENCAVLVPTGKGKMQGRVLSLHGNEVLVEVREEFKTTTGKTIKASYVKWYDIEDVEVIG